MDKLAINREYLASNPFWINKTSTSHWNFILFKTLAQTKVDKQMHLQVGYLNNFSFRWTFGHTDNIQETGISDLFQS